MVEEPNDKLLDQFWQGSKNLWASAEGLLAIAVQSQVDPFTRKKFPLNVILIIYLFHAILGPH